MTRDTFVHLNKCSIKFVLTVCVWCRCGIQRRSMTNSRFYLLAIEFAQRVNCAAFLRLTKMQNGFSRKTNCVRTTTHSTFASFSAKIRFRRISTPSPHSLRNSSTDPNCFELQFWRCLTNHCSLIIAARCNIYFITLPTARARAHTQCRRVRYVCVCAHRSPGHN